MSRSMIKQQNSGATAHVVLYTPRQSTKTKQDHRVDAFPLHHTYYVAACFNNNNMYLLSNIYKMFSRLLYNTHIKYSIK